MRQEGHVACTRERGRAYRILVGKSERVHMEDLGVDGRIMLKRIFKKSAGGMCWIDLAQNKDRWLAIVNMVMNLRISPVRVIT
jgi:hypothetical protein